MFMFLVVASGFDSLDGLRSAPSSLSSFESDSRTLLPLATGVPVVAGTAKRSWLKQPSPSGGLGAPSTTAPASPSDVTAAPLSLMPGRFSPAPGGSSRARRPRPVAAAGAVSAAPTAQLDFARAFKNVPRVAAMAIIERAFPLLVPCFRWVYGPIALTLYGLEEEPGDPGDSAPQARLSLPVERGAKQGDPLGPLLHAATLHLVLCRRDEQTGLTILAIHDDVVAVGPVVLLGGLMRAAATYGATFDAR